MTWQDRTIVDKKEWGLGMRQIADCANCLCKTYHVPAAPSSSCCAAAPGPPSPANVASADPCCCCCCCCCVRPKQGMQQKLQKVSTMCTMGQTMDPARAGRPTATNRETWNSVIVQVLANGSFLLNRRLFTRLSLSDSWCLTEHGTNLSLDRISLAHRA